MAVAHEVRLIKRFSPESPELVCDLLGCGKTFREALLERRVDERFSGVSWQSIVVKIDGAYIPQSFCEDDIEAARLGNAAEKAPPEKRFRTFSRRAAEKFAVELNSGQRRDEERFQPIPAITSRPVRNYWSDT